jgi:glycosyltransferase involved in cell wall biosynthesis
MPSAGPGRGALRLLVVSNMYPSPANPVFGGFVARQADALRALGVEIVVVANTDSSPGAVRALGKYASLRRRAVAAAGGGGFDAVVGHYLYPTAFIARAAARAAGGIPFVLVVHGTDVMSVQRRDPIAALCRSAVRDASLVVTVSHALEARVRGELGLATTVPIEVVNMGVDLSTFKPEPGAREVLDWPQDERIALWVGNMVTVKGVPTLLQAFARVLKEGAADRLVLVGDGPLRGDLEAFADSLGIRDALTFTGRLSQAAVALAMSAADVFVLPSLNEGLSVALLEAMACGTPCVASAVGGVPEVLDDPACGRLVPPGDAEALASGIEDVLRAGKATYHDAALERAKANGSDAMAARFLAAVSGVLESGGDE